MVLSNRLQRPILCYVTDRRSLAKTSDEDAFRAVLQVIESAAAAGVDWIQVREKDLSDGDYSRLTRQALRRTTKPQVSQNTASRIIVNDRLSVALAEGAGGVHLGVSGLPLKEIRKAVGAHLAVPPAKATFLLGSSCHSLRAAASAASDGVDYIFFGPIFATPSKSRYGPPQGLDLLAEVCRNVTIPVFALGGITLDNAASCVAAGASGLAAIRLFQDAADIQGVATALRNLAP